MTKYERHIRKLCRKHKIKILYSRSEFAANPHSSRIWINRRIRSPKTYVSSLHEIGHILYERPKIKHDWKKRIWAFTHDFDHTSKYSVKVEFKAWKIARKLARWWSPAVNKNIVRSLITYCYGYNKTHKRPVWGLPNKSLMNIKDIIQYDDKFANDICQKFLDWA